MKTLLISGETLQEWNVEEIFEERKQNNKDIIEKLEMREIYENRQQWYFNYRLSLLEQLHKL